MKNETIKRTPAVAATVNNGVLYLVFANDEELRLDSSVLTTEIKEYAIMHGLKQKLVDAAAISRNPDTGRPASASDKYEAVKAVYDRLLAGAWNASRGDGQGTGGLLYRALVQMYEGKRSPEWIREFLEGKTKAEQAALWANPKVAAVIDELRAAKADDVDTDAMLGELDD